MIMMGLAPTGLSTRSSSYRFWVTLRIQDLIMNHKHQHTEPVLGQYNTPIIMMRGYQG